MVENWFKIEMAITIACKHYKVEWKDMLKKHYKTSHFNNYKAMTLAIGLLWKDMGYMQLMELFKISQGAVYEMYKQFRDIRSKTLNYVEPIYEYKYHTSHNYFKY